MKRSINILCVFGSKDIFQNNTNRLSEITNFCNSVLVFNSGKEAMDYLRVYLYNTEKSPSICLSDENSPVSNGWDFLEDFSYLNEEDSEKITIYMASTSASTIDLDRASNADGAPQFFINPANQDDHSGFNQQFGTR